MIWFTIHSSVTKDEQSLKKQKIRFSVRKILILTGILAVLAVFSGTAFAQTDVLTSKQTTLSKNLENDPLAQDILRKIAQSKKESAQIQQKELEKNKAKEVLAQKRSAALAALQKDLIDWENQWEELTFEHKFSKQFGMWRDQYNFTNSKILAGKAALKKIHDNGGGPQESRQAYAEAAKTKRAETIIVNALLNIKYGKAVYNQQILFDPDGQFHDVVSGDQLRKYYEDYRLDPVYLKANQNDTASWKEMSKDIHTICREGHVLMYRLHADDHICVTEQTAELWVMNKMGTILFDESIQDTDTPTVEKFKQDRLNQKIKNINARIDAAYRAFDAKVDDLNKKYEVLDLESQTQQRDEEQKLVAQFDNSKSKQGLEQKLNDIRQRYATLKEIMEKEKTQTMQILETNHKTSMENFVKDFETMSDIKMVWNGSHYEAVRR